MCVVERRVEVITRIAERWSQIGAAESFVDPPAVVAALDQGAVDLFSLVLPDISDPSLAGPAVEAEPPWIAKAKCEDFIAAWHVDERVIGRRGIRCLRAWTIDVNPEDLAQQHVEVLRVVWLIVATTTVADADVQVAIESKRKHASVVIGVSGMWNGQQHLFRRVGNVRIGGDAMFGDDDRAVSCTV
jgi:hypothetical protein